MGGAEFIARARRAWPDFEFGQDFAHFIERQPPTAEFEDLALVWACLSKQPGAIAAFTTFVRPAVEGALSRVPLADRADLEQALWLKLFTGTPPGLSQYSGVGSVRGWVRIALSRFALNQATRSRTADESESALLEQIAPQADPEFAALKHELAGDLHGALQGAFLSLTSRERQLLRQVIGQGATVDEVALALGVPRSTAGRHVKDARDRFAAALRTEVANRFGAASLSARRLLDLVESQLDQRWLLVTKMDDR